MKINEFTNALESKYGISIEDTSTRRLTESESHLSQELDEALIDYDEIEFMDDAEVEDFLWDRLNDAECEVMSELGMMIEPSGHGSTGAFFILDEETGRELAVIDFQDYNDKELELSSECDDINQYKEKYKAWVEGFKDVEEALTKVNESHTITEDIGDKYKVVYTPYERYTSSGVKEATFTAPTLYDALCKLCDNMLLYLSRERIEEEQMTAEDIVDDITSSNGDGCDYIFNFVNLSRGEVIIGDGGLEDFMDNWDDLEESREGISIASAVKEAMELDEGKEPPIRKVLEANDIMATLDKDPQGTLEKAIQLVKESDEIPEKDKYTFAQAVGTGPISKRVSSLASYFYDVQRVGKRR